MTEEEKDYIFDTLKHCLDDDMYLQNNIAIYRHDDGRLSYSPFCGTAPIAADGSDEIIYTWPAGGYQDDEDPYPDVEDMLDAQRERFDFWAEAE